MEIEQFQHLGKRCEQQDALWISSDRRFFVVCDGLGGSEDGSIASNLAIKTIKERYRNLNINLNEETFKSIISHSISEINKIKNVNTATTLVSLYLEDNTAYYCHIGDSKLFYISRQKQMWTATKDHSVVQELFDAGVLTTEEEMKIHPYKNKITRAISSNSKYQLENLEIKIVEDLKEGDLFILCTDGVLENHTNKDFVSYFYNPFGNFKSKIALINSNCEEKSKDNSTLIIVKV